MVKITDGKNVLVIPTTAFENYKNSGWQMVARKTKDSIIKKNVEITESIANTDENIKNNNNNNNRKNKKRR